MKFQEFPLDWLYNRPKVMGLTSVRSESLTERLSEEEVRQELDRIVTSRVFRGSQRCRAFLQYVVLKTLEGESKCLKERTIAVDVFGREATEDLSDDSIVRVGAREVRKRLAQYYLEEASGDGIRVELPAGSYIPIFHRSALAPPPKIEPDPIPESPIHGVAAELKNARFTRSKPVLVVGSLVILACAILLSPLRLAGPKSAFDVFWQPAFEAKSAPSIAIAHPIVYQPSLRAQQLNDSRTGVAHPPVQKPISVAPELINGSDFVPSINQYVGFGDAEAALHISYLFAQHHAAPHVRLASRLDFNDLRDSGTVLIGAYTNRWTMNLTSKMRYRFEYGVEGKPCIAENSRCKWTLTTKEDDGRSAEDYILLCRLPHSAANGFTVVCAGLNTYGTEEAGRIISDPDSLAPFLKTLPEAWSSHNLEMVLHLAVVGDAPAQSELVSVYSW